MHPRRLILEGAQIAHGPCASEPLDDAMARGNWKTSFTRAVSSAADADKSFANGKNITTVAEALKAPLERKGRWPSQKFYNGLFVVPRPVAVRV